MILYFNERILNNTLFWLHPLHEFHYSFSERWKTTRLDCKIIVQYDSTTLFVHTVIVICKRFDCSPANEAIHSANHCDEPETCHKLRTNIYACSDDLVVFLTIHGETSDQKMWRFSVIATLFFTIFEYCNLGRKHYYGK